jgi:hypothetical protein
MSSWKKCGMPVVKVWRAPSKKSARAGVGAKEASVNTAAEQARLKNQQNLEIIVSPPELPGPTWLKRRNGPMQVAHSSIAQSQTLQSRWNARRSEKIRAAKRDASRRRKSAWVSIRRPRDSMFLATSWGDGVERADVYR